MGLYHGGVLTFHLLLYTLSLLKRIDSQPDFCFRLFLTALAKISGFKGKPFLPFWRNGESLFRKSDKNVSIEGTTFVLLLGKEITMNDPEFEAIFNAYPFVLKDFDYEDVVKVEYLTSSYFDTYASGYPSGVHQRYRLTLSNEGEDEIKAAVAALKDRITSNR
jgi:hypothetical protein